MGAVWAFLLYQCHQIMNVSDVWREIYNDGFMRHVGDNFCVYLNKLMVVITLVVIHPLVQGGVC